MPRGSILPSARMTVASSVMLKGWRLSRSGTMGWNDTAIPPITQKRGFLADWPDSRRRIVAPAGMKKANHHLTFFRVQSTGTSFPNLSEMYRNGFQDHGHLAVDDAVHQRDGR